MTNDSNEKWRSWPPSWKCDVKLNVLLRQSMWRTIEEQFCRNSSQSDLKRLRPGLFSGGPNKKNRWTDLTPNPDFRRTVTKEIKRKWHLVLCYMIVHRIVKACRVARHLAVHNFQSLEITSACIVFITLLGQDTSSLRLHLLVANQIAEHSTNQIAGASSIHQSPGYDSAMTAKICKCIILSFHVISL